MLKYFLDLRSNLIVYDSDYMRDESLPGDYILCLMRLMRENESFVNIWVDNANLTQLELNEIILRNIELDIEGFITVLPNTRSFLVANHYATQKSIMRLKGKRMLFLSDGKEDPTVLLADEILNCE